MSNKINFLSQDYRQLQISQLEHDEQFPREITYLSNHKKVVHFTLHLAKYCGQLVEDYKDRNSIVDSFILTLCLANMFNLNLSSRVTPSFIALPEKQLAIFSLLVGRMAKACEALDHLESFPYRETFVDCTVDISHTCLKLATLANIDLIEAVPKRLSEVQERSIFKQHLLGESND